MNISYLVTIFYSFYLGFSVFGILYSVSQVTDLEYVPSGTKVPMQNHVQLFCSVSGKTCASQYTFETFESANFHSLLYTVVKIFTALFRAI